MFDEALFIIAVYCVIDDLYRQLYPGAHRLRLAQSSIGA